MTTETIGVWPWDAVRENPGQWCAISEEHAEYCLNVLPPIYFDGGFAVGEAIDGEIGTGTPRYLALTRRNDRPYATGPVTIAEASRRAREFRGAPPKGVA
jgi:hypothetical protein